MPLNVATVNSLVRLAQYRHSASGFDWELWDQICVGVHTVSTGALDWEELRLGG